MSEGRKLEFASFPHSHFATTERNSIPKLEKEEPQPLTTKRPIPTPSPQQKQPKHPQTQGNNMNSGELSGYQKVP